MAQTSLHSRFHDLDGPFSSHEGRAFKAVEASPGWRAGPEDGSAIFPPPATFPLNVVVVATTTKERRRCGNDDKRARVRSPIAVILVHCGAGGAAGPAGAAVGPGQGPKGGRIG
jgi:hypothetical protein